MAKAGAADELRKCFGARMEFGTAGLRAAMGPGVSRMNDLTIIQTTQVRGDSIRGTSHIQTLVQQQQVFMQDIFSTSKLLLVLHITYHSTHQL